MVQKYFLPLDWWNTTVHRLSGGAPSSSGTSDCSKSRHQHSEEGRSIYHVTMASIKFWSYSILLHLVRTMSTGANQCTKLSCRSRKAVSAWVAGLMPAVCISLFAYVHACRKSLCSETIFESQKPLISNEFVQVSLQHGGHLCMSRYMLVL